ncbi:hypothetical protein [Burkholderia ubonensis]|uniref:Coronafacic acid synthetase n=1 Tax=Burkholderia ubonensis subsp. mesacidophila TaxID=265293 RepID=A0A2A4FMQ8_9BURK|nr:hypothetical protein [Burkholderia ubonensis]PCE33696.1 hypothetical protein BZL54_04110 [Burkholderia ubonensis subsp. mesacidophila]
MNVKTTLYSEIRSRNKPSFYAAPVAWATGDFVQSLIDESDAIVPNHTGMIVVSDECSLDTIRELAGAAAQGGISPLRFAGASPSIVVGVPALQQGIRGPTLTLTMSPEHAADPIVAMIRYWIERNGVDAVIVVAHRRHGAQAHLLKGLIVRSLEAGLRKQVLRLCEAGPDEAGAG